MNFHGKNFLKIIVNRKVDIFNITVENILSNYIPHETIKCNDRDPPWINKNIKQS